MSRGLFFPARVATVPPAAPMFVHLLHLIVGRPAPGQESPFVESVHVQDSEPRNPRVERLLLICWVLIAVKHVAIVWVCRHYPVPFHQLWINFPTWLLGALATGIYFARVQRR